jgi:hypothetical protein
MAGPGSLTLTDFARHQLEECGVALSELYRVISAPAICLPGLRPGTQRLNGFGLSVIIRDDHVIEAVEIDGASADDWEGWAEERAAFGDGDVAGADQLVSRVFARSVTPKEPSQRQIEFWERRRRREAQALLRRMQVGIKPEPVPARTVPQTRPEPCRELQPMGTPRPTPIPARIPAQGARVDPANPLAGIHPALHAEITRQAAGDWSRVVVHSPTKVTID